MTDRMKRGVVIAALAAAVVVGAVTWGSGSGSANNAEPVRAGAPEAQPVVVPIADVSEPFIVEYREAGLGGEITDSDENVVQEAALEEAAYRLVYQSEQEWQLEYLDAGMRDVFSHGTFQSWRADELLSERQVEGVVVPSRMAMPLAVEEFHRHVGERGFQRTEQSSERSRAREVYERAISRPHGEHYRSLPWRAKGNIERVTIEYDEDSDRILHYTEKMNGRTVYEYEVISAG